MSKIPPKLTSQKFFFLKLEYGNEAFMKTNLRKNNGSREEKSAK